MRTLATCAALAISLGINHVASAASATKTPPPVVINYEKFKLDNGLEVILHEDHRLPLVAVNVWYHVGPANETAGRTGFAHLFEHMMFEGSKHVGSKAIFKYLERVGATDINGTTDYDRTNYFETLPSNQLELALWLESDRMGYLLDGLDAEKLANQRDVVRNERRQSTEGTPYGLVEEEVVHLLVPPAHPYHAAVIGSHEDIEAARLQDVRAFSRQYYTPTNASLVIAGDIKPAEARSLVQKYFGTIPAGPVVAAPTADTPPITSERRAVVTDQVALPKVYMAWLTAPIFKPGNAEANLIAQILGGGRSARLYKRLVHDLEIAQDVRVANNDLRFASMLQLEATAKPGVTPERLEKAIDEELTKFRAEGPSGPELSRARNGIKTQMLTALQRLGGFGGVADQLNQYNQFLHDPGYLAADLNRFDLATTASVRKVAAEALVPSARVVVYGVPGAKVVDDPPRAAAAETVAAAGPVEGRMPDEPWRAQAPAAGPAPSVVLPTPDRFTLDNGLTVIVAQQHQLPVVAASVVTLAGTFANPVDRPGLASFSAAMLPEGTTTRSAAQIADDAAQSGANLKVGASRDASTASLTVLKTNLTPALNLLADVVSHPKLAPEDVERVRRLREGQLKQLKDQPNEVSRAILLRALYGAEHPFGYPDAGTASGNGKIDVADLKRFVGGRYTPGSAALILAGDVTTGEARTLAEAAFGGWHGKAAPVTTPPVEFQKGMQILLTDFPDAPQTTIRVGVPGSTRGASDYVAREVTNNVFGGLFSSRLNMNLREEHGYTYGAGSGFRDGRLTGYFNAASPVRRDVTAPALKETLGEFARIRTVPPSPEELKLAQGAFAQSLAGLFETSQATSAALADLFVYDLPRTYYAGLPAQAYAVTPADVTAVADRYFGDAALKIVLAGDQKTVEPAVGALGLGKIELVDRDGRAIAAR